MRQRTVERVFPQVDGKWYAALDCQHTRRYPPARQPKEGDRAVCFECP